MQQFTYDLRCAVRALAKTPLFASIAIISLGLALALNTSVFALADAVTHPYVPYPEPDRIVRPSFIGGDPKKGLGFADRFRVIRDEMHTYEAIASLTHLRATMEAGTFAEDHPVVAVSPNFFDVLGVKPALGRGLGVADANGSATQAAVISFRLWNRVFNGDPLSRGLRLNLGSASYTVVGVMPRGVHYPYDTDIWVPESAVPPRRAWSVGPFAVLRLKPGETAQTARAELTGIAARLTAAYSPRRPIGARVDLLSLPWNQPLFPAFLGITVTMVLIIACANLGTMMLARDLARRRETAIRIALGASRTAIVGHVLAECSLIVVAGVGIGFVLTLWSLYLIPHFATPYVPTLGDLQPLPSWRVFAFALIAAITTMLFAGGLPALRAAGTDPAEPMKESAGTTTGRLRDRYNPLIVLEVSLSTALLMCSGLFVVNVVRLATFELGYAAKRIVHAPLFVDVKQIADSSAVGRFYDDLIARARELPSAVAAATFYTQRPEGGMIFAEEGKSGERWINSQGYFVVSPDYLKTFRIPLLSGRDFEPGDRGAGSQGVAIVDERAASRLWPDVPNPVGRMVKLGVKESKQPWLRVVGVAHNVENEPRLDYDLPPEPRVYVVPAHDFGRSRDLIVQGDGKGGDRARAALALAVRREIQAFAPSNAVPFVQPWLANYEGRLTMVGFMASLFGAFGGFGLVLCAVGLYGVLAYTVSRRLREFAVRVALGARRRDVARLVVHDAAVTALAGVGIGAFIALRITREIIETLWTLPYAPAIALVAAEVVLFLAAVLAALGPVRRAAKVDPIELLRAI